MKTTSEVNARGDRSYKRLRMVAFEEIVGITVGVREPAADLADYLNEVLGLTSSETERLVQGLLEEGALIQDCKDEKSMGFTYSPALCDMEVWTLREFSAVCKARKRRRGPIALTSAFRLIREDVAESVYEVDGRELIIEWDEDRDKRVLACIESARNLRVLSQVDIVGEHKGRLMVVFTRPLDGAVRYRWEFIARHICNGDAWEFEPYS